MYVGGYQSYDKPAKCDVTVDENGVKVEKRGLRKKVIFEENWDKIKNVSIEIPDSSGRITASRVVLTGIFALALKKKSNFLIVKLTDGEIVVKTNVPNSGITKINAQLANMVAQWGIKEETSQQPISNADELTKYAALKEKGIITEEEFLEKKKKLLETP